MPEWDELDWPILWRTDFAAAFVYQPFVRWGKLIARTLTTQSIRPLALIGDAGRTRLIPVGHS